MSGITLLGLGPGDPKLLTREAWEILSTADELYVRTRQHPTIPFLRESLHVDSFDALYQEGRTFEEVYAQIVQKILQLGKRSSGVIYAVPGHPFVAEATCPEIARLARAAGIPVKVVEGVSFLEPTLSALGLAPPSSLTLCDALSLGAAHVPPFAPDAPALISQIYSRLVASEVKSTLTEIYPDLHPVRLIHAAGTSDEVVEELALYEIDRSENIGLLTTLFVPPLERGQSFEALQEIVAHLRAPDGCPWDREQTHESLRQHLLEETYEVIAAVDSNDIPLMLEEFGDLLLQIVLNAQIGSQDGEFNINDIVKGIYDKLVRRHPHIFGDVKVNGVEGVLQNWEKLKEAERQGHGNAQGLLDGVPPALPALSQAQEYQDRAARVGFDWPEVGGVLDKIQEEIEEVEGATGSDELSEELGDLFFSLVNLARWKKVDAESALRATNLKFKKRFAFIEEAAKEQSRSLSALSLEELENLWQSAKRN